MSSSEDETVVQTFLSSVKRNNLHPIEADVTDLINAGFIIKDDPTSSSAMKDALLVDLQAKQAALEEAKAAVKALTAVKEAVKLSLEGKMALDPLQDIHQQAQKLIDTHVS